MNVHSMALISCLVAAAAGSMPQVSLLVDCPEYDSVGYSAVNREWPGSMIVERLNGGEAVESAAKAEPHKSPHGTASYVVCEPDTTKPGPWVTRVEIVGNKARPIRLVVRMQDHLSGGARVRWLNEKLLWLQLWRGRIVSTDAVLNIETGRFVYEEDANDNSFIVPCSMKRRPE